MTRRMQWLVFAVTAGLYLAWIGYLGSLAASQTAFGRRPVVVSRAQLLAATHLVVADLKAGDSGRAQATIRPTESLRGGPLPESLTIANLSVVNGFQGPGEYLLPLLRRGDGSWWVAGLPRAPGVDDLPWTPQIYRWMPEVGAQTAAWRGKAAAES